MEKLLNKEINLEEMPSLKAGFKNPIKINNKNRLDRVESEFSDMEFWISLESKGFEHYYVSSKGRVWNRQSGRMLWGSVMGGYYHVSLRSESLNKNKVFRVHRLVAEAFILNPSNKETVNHINGDKMDNRIANLEWLTVEENTQHAHKTLGAGRKRIDIEKVKQAVELKEEGLTYKEISEVIGVSKSAVYQNIKNYLNGERYEYEEKQKKMLEKRKSYNSNSNSLLKIKGEYIKKALRLYLDNPNNSLDEISVKTNIKIELLRRFLEEVEILSDNKLLNIEYTLFRKSDEIEKVLQELYEWETNYLRENRSNNNKLN